MGSASRAALIVATSIGAVEALKDQRVCRWNFVMRSLQQHAKINFRSFSQANKISSQLTSVVAVSKMGNRDEILRQSEESLKKVMYLSCWGS